MSIQAQNGFHQPSSAFLSRLSLRPFLWTPPLTWVFILVPSLKLSTADSFHLKALRCSHPHTPVSHLKCCDIPFSVLHSPTPPVLTQGVAAKPSILLLIPCVLWLPALRCLQLKGLFFIFTAFLAHSQHIPHLSSASGSQLSLLAVPAFLTSVLACRQAPSCSFPCHSLLFAAIPAKSCLTDYWGAELTSRHAGWHCIIVFLLCSICLFPSVIFCLILRP